MRFGSHNKVKGWRLDRLLACVSLGCLAGSASAGNYTVEFARMGAGDAFAGQQQIRMADAADANFIANVRQKSGSYQLDPVLHLATFADPGSAELSASQVAFPW